MTKSTYLQAILICCILNISAKAQQPGLLIHRILANPMGTDSPFELVELVATRSINFANEVYTVVTAEGGNATALGWASGGTGSYGFQISSGTAQKGDLIYVGGSSLMVNGTNCKLLRTINTLTTAGDGFGSPGNGVVGNGGTTADGVAVFNIAANTITTASIPVDALFYGTAIGSGATKNFQLPSNDLYAGGIYGTAGNTFLGPDPASTDYIYITSGTFNTSTNRFTSPRIWTLNQSTPVCTDPSAISFITTLPIQFEYFNVTSDAGIKLSWKITDNLDLDRFEVLLSYDGTIFQVVNTIDKKNETASYQYIDIPHSNGDRYYRIKALEISGNTIYSAIQKISFTGSSHFALTTNPVKQFSDAHLSFSVNAKRSINIYNTSGKLYATIKSDATELNISTLGWGKGIYIIQVKDANGLLQSAKMVIE